MTLEEFHKKAQKELNTFRDYWLTRSEQYPDNYPIEMPEEEWWEQLQTYGSFNGESSDPQR